MSLRAAARNPEKSKRFEMFTSDSDGSDDQPVVKSRKKAVLLGKRKKKGSEDDDFDFVALKNRPSAKNGYDLNALVNKYK